jgi:hypothetical protein
MTEKTSQELGRDFDYELADLIGGKRVKGSGNRSYAKLDARGTQIAVEGKYTDAESFRVTEGLLDKIARAVLGPEATYSSDVAAFLVVKIGPNGRPKAVIDLALLLEWIASPPELVEATSQDRLRATAKTPPFLR